MKFWLTLLFLTFTTLNLFGQTIENRQPKVGELKLISQLPAEFPQRVSTLAFDGEKLWAAIYQNNGKYATFNLQTQEWKAGNNDQQHKIFTQVAAPFAAVSGMAFVGKKLWIGGSYGESIGLIDLENQNIEKQFKQKYKHDNSASQSYSGMAYDGDNIWIAWHWFKYKLPTSQTQLLLKLDTETGKIVSEYPLPAGTANDGTHGLTWDGKRLWHLKDSRLSAISTTDGSILADYIVDKIKRPSGLAWDGEALWIIEWDGKLWRLPL